MTLKVQVMSLIISFLYGIFFSIFLNLNYKIIYNNNKIYKIGGTFLFVLVNVLLYFLIIKKVNNGVVHIYCLISIILGTFLEHFVLRKIFNRFTIKYKK